MANPGTLADRLPIAPSFLQEGPDFGIKGFLAHADSLVKFSWKSKEHFTKRLGHPRWMPEEPSINLVLARNLAYWMEQAEVTQTALAKSAGVSQKTISNYLNPEQRAEGSKGKEPSAKLTELAKIASALHISTWQLLREMSPSERKMYESIERHYAEIRQEATEAALANGPNTEDLKLFEGAHVQPVKKKPKKRTA